MLRLLICIWRLLAITTDKNSPAFRPGCSRHTSRNAVEPFSLSRFGCSHHVRVCQKQCPCLAVVCFAFVYSTAARPPCQPFATAHPCGDKGTRTLDLRLAKAPLSQLSYIPKPASHFHLFSVSPPVGLTRLERVTSPLSGACSNQLSYRPVLARICCRSLNPRSVREIHHGPNCFLRWGRCFRISVVPLEACCYASPRLFLERR